MKKNLKLFAFSFLALCSSVLFSQTEKLVFMVDNATDITKGSIEVVRVFPDPKSTSGFSLPEYKIVKNRVEIPNVDNGKRLMLQVDPRRMQKFVEVEIANGQFNAKELTFAIDKPGEFINLEGELIYADGKKAPGLRKALISNIFRKPIENNKSVTNKNTVANSKLEDANATQDRISESIAIPNTKFGIGFQVQSLDGQQSKKVVEFNFFLVDQFGQFVSSGDANFRNFQSQMILNVSNPLGRGEAITIGQCVAKNMADLLVKCKNGSKPAFFGSTDFEKVNQELTPILSDGCPCQNPRFFVNDIFFTAKNIFFK